MHFVVPLWLALLGSAVLIYLAWNVAVSAAIRRLYKDAFIACSAALVVLLLLGAFGYGPLYRPHPPAPRGGCAHNSCLRMTP